MSKFQEWVEDRKSKSSDRVVVIMRGLPGSGKSFTAKKLLKKYGGGDPYHHIFSTDDYFIQDVINEKRAKLEKDEPVDHQFYDELEKETYRSNWASEKLAAAHNWNFYRFKQAIDNWMTPLIVDNTNVKAFEMRRYVEYAEKAGYKILIEESDAPWWKDHAHMLKNKDKYGRELEDFARFLAGHHQGMAKKYGANGNTHGVPIDVIRRQIRKWQPNLTTDDVMERSDRFQKK